MKKSTSILDKIKTPLFFSICTTLFVLYSFIIVKILNRFTPKPQMIFDDIINILSIVNVFSMIALVYYLYQSLFKFDNLKSKLWNIVYSIVTVSLIIGIISNINVDITKCLSKWYVSVPMLSFNICFIFYNIINKKPFEKKPTTKLFNINTIKRKHKTEVKPEVKGISSKQEHYPKRFEYEQKLKEQEQEHEHDNPCEQVYEHTYEQQRYEHEEAVKRAKARAKKEQKNECLKLLHDYTVETAEYISKFYKMNNYNLEIVDFIYENDQIIYEVEISAPTRAYQISQSLSELAKYIDVKSRDIKVSQRFVKSKHLGLSIPVPEYIKVKVMLIFA